MSDFSSHELGQFIEKSLDACRQHDYGQASLLEHFIIDLELGIEPARSPLLPELVQEFDDLDAQRLIRSIAAIYRQNAAARNLGPKILSSLGRSNNAIPMYLTNHPQRLV